VTEKTSTSTSRKSPRVKPPEDLQNALRASLVCARYEEGFTGRALRIRAALLIANCYNAYRAPDPQEGEQIARLRELIKLAVDLLDDEDVIGVERAIMAMASVPAAPDFIQRRANQRRVDHAQLTAQIQKDAISRRQHSRNAATVKRGARHGTV